MSIIWQCIETVLQGGMVSNEAIHIEEASLCKSEKEGFHLTIEGINEEGSSFSWGVVSYEISEIRQALVEEWLENACLDESSRTLLEQVHLALKTMDPNAGPSVLDQIRANYQYN